MDFVEIAGVRYVRATDIARQFGYTSDYVGQLSRAGKIDAKQIGRVWYIKEGELDVHKKENIRSNKKKTQVILRKTLEEESLPGRIYNSIYTPPPGSSEFRKRLLDTSIRYEHDEHPLTPPVATPHPEPIASEHIREEHTPLPVQPVSEVHLSVDDEEKEEVHVLDVDAGEENEHFLLAERPEEPRMQGRLDIEDIEEREEKEREVQEQQKKEREEREKKILLQGRFKGHQIRTLSRPAPTSVLSPVPIIALAKPKPLALRSPLITALVPLVLLLAFAFSFSSIFLHRVLVYNQNPASSTGPYYSTSVGVTELSSVIQSLSR